MYFWKFKRGNSENKSGKWIRLLECLKDSKKTCKEIFLLNLLMFFSAKGQNPWS